MFYQISQRSIRLALCIFMVTLAPITRLWAVEPVITTDVTVANGVKTYTYYLTNPEGSGYDITSIDLWMPEAGARAVIGFTASLPGCHASPDYRGANSSWEISGMGLWEGATCSLWLTTASDVPTAYDFLPSGSDQSNWGWGTEHDVQLGTGSLPVPVPEESGMNTVSLGLASLGAVKLWLAGKRAK